MNVQLWQRSTCHLCRLNLTKFERRPIERECRRVRAQHSYRGGHGQLGHLLILFYSCFHADHCFIHIYVIPFILTIHKIQIQDKTLTSQLRLEHLKDWNINATNKKYLRYHPLNDVWWYWNNTQRILLEIILIQE